MGNTIVRWGGVGGRSLTIWSGVLPAATLNGMVWCRGGEEGGSWRVRRRVGGVGWGAAGGRPGVTGPYARKP